MRFGFHQNYHHLHFNPNFLLTVNKVLSTIVIMVIIIIDYLFSKTS